jgi:hypothetical protein
MVRKTTKKVAHEEQITGRHDLVSALKRLEYTVKTRTGKLYLMELCTVNYAGCIRLFKDIDPDVIRIEVFSGEVLDGIYFRKDGGGWKVSGFPYDKT